MADNEPTQHGDSETPTITRRRLLAAGGGGALAAAGGGVVYNTQLGYGRFTGTNLRKQDLDPVVTERLDPTFDETLGEGHIRTDDAALVADGDRLPFDADRDAVASVDRHIAANDRLLALWEDLAALDRGEFTIESSTPSAFFDRIAGATARPETVTAIRGRWDQTVDVDLVERFAATDPADPRALVDGLADAFERHTDYDIPRYLAGAIEDNVLFGAVDLRSRFEAAVDFESLLADDPRIFCWELTYRAIEALHAVEAAEQTLPVAACYVSDRRHKHVYTGVVSAVRDEGTLVLPMTFLDYTAVLLDDTPGFSRLFGDGLAAYDRDHRADEIYW
ncbi:uncharacterized protein NP_1874A [Natronomonas pharaonis DSM 2160]|uniref:Uncharacterized protein n=1 Tax=Natronomonas pharaonis (strain ATCC 35678 / DSM 2160 / CIP 103997 / JCM 8858 / NBRC 14720 / NCIMB 2260 / Gabara) TaxID=348780 RepID=A0A1U7EVI4_NATPD|nr:hypothetical protein [Natronomonas pharaonis]CAI49028.1 uncharacterized protein NP_1874A [Natronomonas pharaonis DSM 2160]